MYGKKINIPRLQAWMGDAGINPQLYQSQKDRQEWSDEILII